MKAKSNQSASRPPAPQRGEIWWLNQNPVIPKDPHLPRPVVIISTNPRNKNWDSVIVVPLSTGLKNVHLPFHKLIPKGEGGLTHDSYVRCDLISNIEKVCLDPTGPLEAVLSEKFIWEIVKGIRVVVGDNPYLL